MEPFPNREKSQIENWIATTPMGGRGLNITYIEDKLNTPLPSSYLMF